MLPQSSLKLLMEVSGTAEEKAARQLAHANRELAQARARHELLTNYLREYETRFASSAGQSTDAGALRNYRAFLAQLNRAIDEQGLIVAQREAARAQREGEWRSKKFRVKSFELLGERALMQATQRAERIEQRQTDERAAALWQRSRKA